MTIENYHIYRLSDRPCLDSLDIKKKKDLKKRIVFKLAKLASLDNTVYIYEPILTKRTQFNRILVMPITFS